MNKKSNVSWVKPSEPSFLRKFKKDVGFKEGPTVETKRQELPQCDEDSGDSDREDELPQVVVLKKGDISAEEAMQLKNKTKDADDKDEQPPVEGKILFKKPTKRSSEKSEGITAQSNSKKKRNVESEKKKESGVKVKNSSLLSFGDDEEEEED